MVSTFVQPNAGAQTGTVYKTSIDDSVNVVARDGDAFAPHASSPAAMTVDLDAGHLFDGTTLTEKAAQVTGTITAPSTNPRIDRLVIDRATGVVSVVGGVEDASPVPPAITAAKLPVAQVALVVSQTTIVNADITDERHVALAGLKKPSQAEAEAGTATLDRVWTAQRVKQAINALSSAGGWTLIESQTAANVASIDLTTGIDGTYDMYAVVITGLQPIIDDSDLWVRMRVAAVFRATAGDYSWAAGGAVSGAVSAVSGSTSDVKIVLNPNSAGNGLGNAAADHASLVVYFSKPASTTLHKNCHSHMFVDRGTGDASAPNAGGALKSVTGAVDGFRFLMSSGNINIGDFDLFGIKKA